jgi:hypothetical protein
MLPLFLTKYHAMRMYGRVKVQIHAVLTLALDGGEWSASHPGRKEPPVPIGQESWVDRRTGLDAVEKRETSLPLSGIEPVS